MSLPPYNPKAVVIKWNGLDISTGLAEDFLTISPSADLTTTVVGADGRSATTISPDFSGTMELTYLQTSNVNLDLSRVLEKQRASGTLLRGTFEISDPSGSLSLICKDAHLMQRPEISLGIEQQNKTWTFFVEDIVYTVPDNLGEQVASSVGARVDGWADDTIALVAEQIEQALGGVFS